ncbi:MAG: hypothetical protein A4E35_00637 [Methanoregula sp. PtaU1.Bin051]|nr:MAG: hypothetical protein A4E35_00637 [Methanoregula sp. PtaU1.Bin051]
MKTTICYFTAPPYLIVEDMKFPREENPAKPSS